MCRRCADFACSTRFTGIVTAGRRAIRPARGLPGAATTAPAREPRRRCYIAINKTRSLRCPKSRPGFRCLLGQDRACAARQPQVTYKLAASTSSTGLYLRAATASPRRPPFNPPSAHYASIPKTASSPVHAIWIARTTRGAERWLSIPPLLAQHHRRERDHVRPLRQPSMARR